MEFLYKDAIESWKSESKQYDNSCYLMLLYPLKLDQPFKISRVLLISMMLNQFYDFVATCNLNS
jgi:hypothetical protein